MAATISVNFVSQVTVTETFSAGLGSDNTASFAPQNESTTLNAGTSPAATKHAAYNVTLSTGTGSIDLTALPGITADETVNGTGLKVQYLKFTNPSTNANKITVAKGASNGYFLDNATTWSFVLAPGQTMTVNCNGASAVIGGSAKIIDVTGTGSQILNVQVVMG